MFTAKDKEMLGNPYFKVITKNTVMYEVQSRNTGHYWVIFPLQDKKTKYVRLMHKYKTEHDYHEQTTTGSVLDAVLEIICHDDFKLKTRNPIFEQFVQQYS